MTKIYDNYLVVPRKLLTCLTEGKAGNSKRECQTLFRVRGMFYVRICTIYQFYLLVQKSYWSKLFYEVARLFSIEIKPIITNCALCRLILRVSTHHDRPNFFLSKKFLAACCHRSSGRNNRCISAMAAYRIIYNIFFKISLHTLLELYTVWESIHFRIFRELSTLRYFFYKFVLPDLLKRILLTGQLRKTVLLVVAVLGFTRMVAEKRSE